MSPITESATQRNQSYHCEGLTIRDIIFKTYVILYIIYIILYYIYYIILYYIIL